jgi:mannosyl-glycoprotein endo-beta-N-acetylglucosaminidase
MFKVLGTFIMEGDEGTTICKTLMASKESAEMYADRLTELAIKLGFDGWLVRFFSLLTETLAFFSEMLAGTLNDLLGSRFQILIVTFVFPNLPIH